MLIKNIISRLCATYRNRIWEKDSKKIKGEIKKKINSDKIVGKTLILIPHADDEWVGCSQIIIKHPTDIVFCNMNMPGGDSEELHRIRFEELSSIARRYNVPLITVESVFNEKINGLIKLIKQERPSFITVPFYYDWHDEHIEVMTLLKRALEQIKLTQPEILDSIKVLMYQVSVPIPEECITHCVPMKQSDQKTKWDIFDTVYKTQSSIPWARFQYNEYINGALCDEYAAEVYVSENAEVWMANVSKKVLREIIRKEIVDNLQDLRKVREIVKKVSNNN